MWVKCRQRRPPCFSSLFTRVPPSGVPFKKSSTTTESLGQQERMFHRPLHFVRDEPALNDALFPSSSSAVPAAAKAKP